MHITAPRRALRDSGRPLTVVPLQLMRGFSRFLVVARGLCRRCLRLLLCSGRVSILGRHGHLTKRSQTVTGVPGRRAASRQHHAHRRFGRLWRPPHTKAAGLPRIRLHDVRHSYASAGLANASGWGEVKVMSERLGHASIGITLDTYSHVLPDQDADVAATLATVILGR
jgi:integrase